jgi:hypothetical protein
MTRVEFQPGAADDRSLVARIGELVQAKQATEAALAEAVREYSARRYRLVRAGKRIEGALSEPVNPGGNFLENQARREQLGAQGYEHDQSLMADPRTRTLLQEGA